MSQPALQCSPLGMSCTLRPRTSAFRSTALYSRSRVAVRVVASSQGRPNIKPAAEPSAAFLLALSTIAGASSALAEELSSSIDTISAAPVAAPVAPEAVDSAVSQIVDAVKAGGGLVKSGLETAAKGLGYAKEAADTATPYVKSAVDVATPYVKAGANIVQEVAKPVVKFAGPVVQSGVGEVERFLTKQGLNSQTILDSARTATSKAGEAVEYAKPTVQSTAGTLSATSPQTLGQYAIALIGLYYLGPPVLKRVFGGLRGYRGQISPAAALDAVATDGNAFIVDIRSGSDKEYTGIPDIPNRGRLIELEFATISDRKIRGQLRNVNDIEKQMTVLQLASLKKVKKGSRILLLDKNGGVAKDIAKALTRRGYKRVFVISGGFSGWQSSKLQTRNSTSVSAVEILSPVFGTQRGNSSRSSRSDRPQRALPSGR